MSGVRNMSRPKFVRTSVTPLKIDIWSDIACPWCFIGKRRLEKALANVDAPVTIEYHSFELAPDTPVDFDGSEIDFLVAHKRMDAGTVQGMLAQVSQVASEEGLAYDFESLRHTNTRKAHEALHFAKTVGLQSELKERLLKAYFEEGRHLGNLDELIALGVDVGLEQAALTEALHSGVFANEVSADVDRAREMGVTGVPFFVFNGRFGVAGAQSPEVFLDVIERLKTESAS